MNKKQIYQASFLVALSGILYGFLGFLGTSVLRENFSIVTMSFWRFAIAGCWMMLFAFRRYSKGKMYPVNKQILIVMFLLGALGYAGSSGFYFAASRYAGTGLAMVIFFSYPVVVALTSWMRDKNFSWVTFCVLVIMVFGLLLLRGSSLHPLSLVGIFFGVVSAVLYAFYVVGSKRFSLTSVDSVLLAMMVSYGCAFIFLICSLVGGSFAFPHDLKCILYLLSLGILATAIPIQLMLEGLKVVSSMRASIISVLEPLVTVFVGILLLNESLSPQQIVGTVIILSSAVLIQFHREL